MEIKFEFETKIKTNDKEKKTEKKISISNLKEKAKETTKSVTKKISDAASKAANKTADALLFIADTIGEGALSIYDYLDKKEEESKSEKSDEEESDDEESDDEEDFSDYWGDNGEEDLTDSENLEADEPEEVSDLKKKLEELKAKFPEGEVMSLAKYLDTTNEYNGEFAFDIDSVKAFFKAINYPASEYSVYALLNFHFLRSHNLSTAHNKIAYKIRSLFEDESVTEIVEKFETDFKNWLEIRPDIKEHCYKPNFRMLCLYFYNKFKA